jgi:omega-6 fatty acid desaturase (delta-12 desaturase)
MTISPLAPAVAGRLAAGTQPNPSQADASYWLKLLRPYREPRLARSMAELAITAVPFLALWLLMWLSLGYAYWLCLVLSVPAAGFLLRLFTIQHDCGHGSFFHRRRTNDWVGRVIGVFTLTPYGHWRHAHAIHHATSGNLEQRGIGDIDTLTVREFEQLSTWRQRLYRLSRNPLFLLGLGAPYLFVLHYRLPARQMHSNTGAWRSTMSTNLAIAAVVGGAIALIGLRDFLLIQVPITWLASSAGLWLFYVQHQFEGGHWEQGADWNVHSAAIHGSSHLHLPAVLRWFTANIGVHHVHHLSSRIPGYRLGEVLRSHPELDGINRLTFKDTLGCFRLALWDENKEKLVGFHEGSMSTA